MIDDERVVVVIGCHDQRAGFRVYDVVDAKVMQLVSFDRIAVPVVFLQKHIVVAFLDFRRHDIRSPSGVVMVDIGPGLPSLACNE